MQDLLEEESLAMTEQRIDLGMLSRIDSEQKATASRVDKIDEKLQGLAREVSEIKGSIKPPSDTPWWLRFLVAPLCVAAILATTGAVIHLEIVVNGIEKNVGGLQASTARQNLTTYAALPPTDFRAALPDISSSIGVARKHNVKIPPTVVDDLSTQLKATEPSTSGFWPAAAEFISYRSEMLSGWAQTALPSCSEQLPVGRGVTKSSVPTSTGQYAVEIEHGPMVYRNCKIILDSPEATTTLSPYLNIGDLVFEQCAIFYRGGPIIFVPVRVATQTPTVPNGKLIFTNCIFDVSLPAVPPSDGRTLIVALLASPSGNAEVNIPIS
jgi:hypothetical protein